MASETSDGNESSKTNEFLICGQPRIHIPHACQGVDVIIGVDEAGRGPVLGSLLYAAAFWPASEDEQISKLGFDDSKVLKEEQRNLLFEQIVSHPSIGWVVQEITPVTISNSMLKSTPISLNRLSYDAVVTMLTHITSSSLSLSVTPPLPSHVYVDTVGDPDYYKSYLTSSLSLSLSSLYRDAQFTVEKKADAKYRSVSCASIIAKVLRDRLLQSHVWEEKGLSLDCRFGSGYPSDDICVQWMERAYNHVFGFPLLVRHSWSTCRDVIQRKRGSEVK